MEKELEPQVIRDIRDMILANTEALIGEIRNWECLWNPKSKGYKKKNTMKLAWQNVTAKVVSDYRSRPISEQSEFVRAVQARWKGVRDAYFRCKSLMKKSQGKYKYMYYDFLTFLDRVREDEDDDCSETSAANDEETDPLEIDTNSSHPPETVTPRTHPLETSKTRTHSLEPSTTRTHPLEIDITQKQSLNKRRKVMESQEIPSDSTETPLQGDDVAFFNSLAPILNELDSYKKLVFRARIMELAVDVAGLRSTIKLDPDI